jgi:hypothetical protein
MCKHHTSRETTIPTVALLKVPLRKKVCFSSVVSSSLASKKSYTNEDAERLWYQHHEITNFKLEVKRYIFGAHIFESRGLERHQSSRAQNKTLARMCTLVAFVNGYRNEDLAVISQQCSAAARDEAFAIACQDYCDVYHTNRRISPIVRKAALAACQSNYNKSKRRVFPDIPQRRVRTRIN